MPPRKWTKAEIVAAYLDIREDLVRFLSARCPSAMEAEDIVQDIWVSIEKQDELATDDVRAYLYQLASRTAARRLRERNREARNSAGSDDAAGVGLPTEFPPLDEAADSRLRLARLIEGVAALPPQCRRVFILHKLQGLSYAEVADVMEISRSAVEKHMMLALQRLAAL